MLTSVDPSATQYIDVFVVSSHSVDNVSSFCDRFKLKDKLKTLNNKQMIHFEAATQHRPSVKTTTTTDS